MKERILYDDEFEKQLKAKADQFKMYPSDKVWNEVYSSLHTRRRRFVAGMTVLVASILILAGTQLIFPSRVIHPKSITAKVNNTSKPATGAALHSFPTNAFTADATDRSEDQPGPDVSQALISPFDAQTAALYDKPSSADQQTVNLSPESPMEKVLQPAPRIKGIQATDMLISAEQSGRPV